MKKIWTMNSRQVWREGATPGDNEETSSMALRVGRQQAGRLK